MKNFRFHILGILALAIASTTAVAQDRNAANNIAIMTIIPTQADGLPSGAEAALKNKMDQLTLASGLGSMNDYSQFCMLVNIDIESKDIVSGAPVKIAQTLNFNFYIVDQLNQTVFAATSIRAKGVGDNETKAYVQAIKQFNTRSSNMISFIDAGKRKIIEYYTANCDKIIMKANSLAKQEQFEEALFLLGQIPDACHDCYIKATAASDAVFQAYIDAMCKRNLAKAKAIWSSTQTSEGGLAAGVFLSEIYPDSACYPEAEKLYNEITARVKEDINFQMKKWDDVVSLESQRIDAGRAVGVAWGNNQKPITYAPVWLR